MTSYSMFIQPFGYTPEKIRTMLELAKEVHESPGGHHIYNICIEHVANNRQDPPPWEILDIIMEYAPGGSRATFDNLFVGSSNLMYNGPKYREGIKDVNFRTAALLVAEDYAHQFAARYPDRYYHFYVDFEARAELWVDDAIREGYVYLLSQWQDIYESIHPNRNMLYAPATWQLPVPSGMSDAVADLFTRVRTLSDAQKGINWITFQDMYGRQDNWLDPTPLDVENWLEVFSVTGMFDNVGTTTELFEIAPGYYGVGNPGEVLLRMDAYAELGIKQSFAFELRYWYQLMMAWGGEPDVEEVPPLDDTPAYLETKLLKPGDSGFSQVADVLDEPGTVSEVTVIGLHDG